MGSLLQDVRVGIRMLLKNPAFTCIAVVVLGLGIGANTAMFSLVNGLLLRPPGIEEPQQLQGLFSKDTEQTGSYRAFSYPNYRDIRERNDVFQDLMAHNPAMVGIGEGEDTRRVFASVVSANYFKTYGVRLPLGRAFEVAEEQPGSAARVAVIGHHLWKRRGSAPDILGQTVRVNGEAYTIIGVAPESFPGPVPALSLEVFLPLGVYESVINNFGGGPIGLLSDRENHNLMLVGRLKVGMTTEKAGSQLEGLASQMSLEFPEINRNQTLVTAPISRFSLSTAPRDDSAFGAVSAILMGMAGIVLLLACLNLGHMQASRSAARRQEFAVRRALGGSSRRVIRQLLVEGLILSLCGGIIGFLLSIWAPGALLRSLTQIIGFELVLDASSDWRVVVATFGFCFLSTLFFSLRPALRLSRSPLFEDLKAQRGSASQEIQSRGWLRGRNFPVISEVALSLALLIVAGLFVRGAMQAAGVDPGFKIDGSVLIETDISLLGYSDERSSQIYQELLERFRSHPGVEAASLTSTIPFGMTQSGRTVQEVGVPFDSLSRSDPQPRSSIVGAEFFKAIGTPLLDGRSFSPREEQTAQPVVMIDKILAETLWPQERAVGKRIHFKGAANPAMSDLEVIGVVGSIQDDFFSSEVAPRVFVPMGLTSQTAVHFVVRARNEQVVAELIPELRSLVREVDPRLPVFSTRTMESHLSESVSFWLVKAAASIFSAFGVLALLLAVIGVYGVRAYSVVRRTREIGVRMALGASIQDTIWMVLREGLVMTVVGCTLGILLALGLGQVVGSLLYAVSSTDIVVYALGTLTLTVVMMLACYLPARRAARIDPLQALRCE